MQYKLDRRRPGRLLAVTVLLLTALLSGCFSQPHTDPFLQESVEVGESMFAWGDAEHFVTPGSTRNITADFELPSATGTLGVSFQGSFSWRNSTAWLELKRPDGSMALELRAQEGLEDDHGAIASLFHFDRLVDVDDVGPGEWDVRAGGMGNISSLDFRVHAISALETAVQRSFTIPDDDLPVRMIVTARGWGGVPTGVLEAPDGSMSQISLSGPRGEAESEWSAQEGNHTLTMDTSDWGGRMTMQVLPR